MSVQPDRPETGYSDSDDRRDDVRRDDVRRDDRSADLGHEDRGHEDRGHDDLRTSERRGEHTRIDDRTTDESRSDDLRADSAAGDTRGEGVRSWSDGDGSSDDSRTGTMRSTGDTGTMRSTGDIDTSYRSGAGAAAAGTGAAATAGTAAGGNQLLGDDHDLTSRWDQVQATFVDDPRRAVSDAAGLVEDTLKRLSDTFAKERARGESAGDDAAGTEDLRLAMQRYREFFRRLLAV